MKAKYKQAKEEFKMGEDERELIYRRKGLSKEEIKMNEYQAEAEVRKYKHKLELFKRKRKLEKLRSNYSYI